MVRFGLIHLIGDLEGFEVCGEAGNAPAAKESVKQLLPDLIVLDLALGGRDGPELIVELRQIHPPARILVYSALPEQIYAQRVFRAGADGYLSKDKGLDFMPEALAALSKGETYASPEVHRAFFQQFVGKTAPAASNPILTLSDRELQILRLLAQGLGSDEIAADLHISPKTVGTHRERLKQKLGVSSARELLRLADEFQRAGQL